MRLALLIVLASIVAACGPGFYTLADRGDAEVRATEAELMPIVSASEGGADCTVRLLGESDNASFVWASCVDAVGDDPVPTALSVPMRIEGTAVRRPSTPHYVDDVRELFPEGLAHLILDDPDKLRP